MTPVIRQQLEQERDIHAAAAAEIKEFEDAFKLEQINQTEEDPNKRQRVTWRQIIEEEEQKLRLQQQVQEVTAAPLTEEEAARLKENKGEDEDPDTVKQIGTVNPVNDFQKMITDRKVDRVSTALRQIQEVIKKFVRSSLGGDLYDKAIECLLAMRQGSITEDEAQTFNRFLH